MTFYDNLFACYNILALKVKHKKPQNGAFYTVCGSQALFLGLVFGIFKRYTSLFSDSSTTTMKLVLGLSFILSFVASAFYFWRGDRMDLAIKQFSDKSKSARTFWAIISAAALIGPPCTYGFLFRGN